MKLHSFAVLAALLLHAAIGQAQTLKVLTAGAVKEVVLAVVPGFEARTAVKVDVQTDTAGGLVKRIESGQAFDVVVATRAGIDRLAAAGKVDSTTSANVADVGIGVGVKEGAPLPAIATVEQFKAAVLNAKKVAYIDPASGGSSGIYLDRLFGQMGIGDAVKAKAVLVPGGLAAERVVSGEADLVLQQVSEVLSVRGVALVGMLPDAIQNYTIYAVGLSTQSATSETARSFVAALIGKEGVEAMQSRKMRPAR